MGKKSGGGSRFEVNEYNMSIHYAVCHGPVDALLEVVVDEKLAWAGSIDGESEFNIVQPNLFGGQKKEGGLLGTVLALFGGPGQTIPDRIANRMGVTSGTCPGYRGILSLFFYGGVPIDYNSPGIGQIGGLEGIKSGASSYGGMVGARPGFCWKTNVPYLPGTWVKVRRQPRGMTSTPALIGPDANPAHMIYECITNTDWGMGSSPTILDVPSFEAAAQTLFNEAFGLSMVWTTQTSIEAFINEILDHIQAVFFLNPRTGLLTLKLIRADYDAASLPLLTPDNSKIMKFQRKSWAETTNEIVLTWTNPENEQDETVILQDLGNVTQQGSTVSDTRNYYGVRYAALANRLAARDLRAVSVPIASFEIEVDRSGWDLLPGGVVRLTDPEYGIFNLVLRIGPIDYGKPGQPTIKITATEDVFTLQTQAYAAPATTGWIEPGEAPAPLTYVRPFTMPAYLTSAMARRSITNAVYPEVLIGFLAAQNNNDTINYELIDHATGAALGTRTMTGYTTLQAPWVAEAKTVIPSFSVLRGIASPSIGQLVFIGDGSDAAMEIAVIRNYDANGWTLDRGVLDTVPRDWGAGTRLWFVNIASTIYDARTLSAFDNIAYRLLPRTSRGLLALADAPITGVVSTDRPYLPLRPANVMIGASGFGLFANAGSGPWPVTWANRNRKTEDSVIMAWNAGTVPVEVNTTTTITVMSIAGAVLTTIDGLTGTSYSLPKSAFAGQSSGRVRVTSKRDGFTSLQGHEIRVEGIT